MTTITTVTSPNLKYKTYCISPNTTKCLSNSAENIDIRFINNYYEKKNDIDNNQTTYSFNKYKIVRLQILISIKNIYPLFEQDFNANMFIFTENMSDLFHMIGCFIASSTDIYIINTDVSRKFKSSDIKYVQFEFIQNLNSVSEKRDVVKVSREKKKQFKTLIKNINTFYNNTIELLFNCPERKLYFSKVRIS